MLVAACEALVIAERTAVENAIPPPSPATPAKPPLISIGIFDDDGVIEL